MVGALLLALQIIGGAREQARKAEALGSIESLAELSAQMTSAVHALQLERASEALVLGLHKQAANKGGSSADDDAANSQATASASREAEQRIEASDRALSELRAFLNSRDMSRLPPRLAGPLIEAQERLKELPALRARFRSGEANVADVFELHRVATQAFVRAIAGLTDLSDDGDLLRSITSLVSLLQLEDVGHIGLTAAEAGA